MVVGKDGRADVAPTETGVVSPEVSSSVAADSGGNVADLAGSRLYIGWDVGGWKRDKNRESRDALVILDSTGAIKGSPWRGNLRNTLEAASTADGWVMALLRLCAFDPPTGATVVLAIDTPLGFPAAFLDLVAAGTPTELSQRSGDNAYLFRETERFLFKRGFSPLSAIKDMIGSQATKGIHAVRKFAPVVESPGVWRSNELLTVIETYPAVCRRCTRVQSLFNDYPIQKHADVADALVCALIARDFDLRRESLIPPPRGVPQVERWIWVPSTSVAVARP